MSVRTLIRNILLQHNTSHSRLQFCSGFRKFLGFLFSLVDGLVEKVTFRLFLQEKEMKKQMEKEEKQKLKEEREMQKKKELEEKEEIKRKTKEEKERKRQQEIESVF